MEKFNLSDEELYSKELSELIDICENLAFNNREERDYAMKALLHKVSFIDQGFRDFTRDVNSLEKSFNENDYFKSYDEQIRRLELQLNANEIDSDSYEEKLLIAKTKLYKSCWDILKIKSYDAEKLFNLNLISQKQLETIINREIKEESEKVNHEKKRKERELRSKKEFYVDYIQGKNKFTKDPESYISVKRQNKIYKEASNNSGIGSMSIKSSAPAKPGCFIATSTMGNYDHPVVIDLRMFRDQWLLKRNWGISFTKWYYLHGPKAAKAIDRSIILKKLSYIIIVKPLQLITKKLR
jgi:hypothetical protein